MFIVNQNNAACHTGRYSCFDEKNFNLNSLYKIIQDRKINPKNNSYTNKLLDNKKLLLEKILEESKEVVNSQDRRNLIWELADILYFLNVLMVQNNIKIEDIENELLLRNIVKKIKFENSKNS